MDHQSGTANQSSAGVPEPLAQHPRYEIIDLIGKGGMGDVYEARHRKMERTVALKVINRELFRKTAAVDRFHREVKAAAQLSHPNIVTAHDADQAGDFHFMVMEYVDGVDLSQSVKQRGALPINEACEYTRQAALGLQHAHEKRMVHRDIKPHNLMVTDDRTVKILDFGLASLAPVALPDKDTVEACGDLTVAGAIMGTPDFISPEQAKDARQADIRSDIYSLGATLYFLLTGRPPFAEGSVTHRLKSHSQAEPEPLETLRHDLPPKLLAIVSKMMAKDPSERFQTPAEVAEVLESVACETERRETTKSLPQVQPRRRKPSFLPLTGVAALLLGIICAATVFYLQFNHGTVRVELSDPSLQVSIEDHTITLSDEDGKSLTIRPGEETLIIRNGEADFQFETKRFQIRRGVTIAFKVEMLKDEIVVRKDGELFDRASLDDASTAADKAASVSNLRQIARAFMMFEHEHGYLPSVTTRLPGAKHPVSWRVAILKYLDEDLYNQYRLDEPWYSNHNKSLLNSMPSCYRHPRQEKEITSTCYVTLVGENTATGNGETPTTDSDAARTILVTEGYTRIPWTKPGDLFVGETTMLPSRRPHQDGWNVVFVDGSAHFISAEAPIDELQALIARNGSTAVSKTDAEKTANVEAESKTDWSKVNYTEFWLTTDKPLEEVRMTIQEYYVDKYPLFAELIDQDSKTWRTPETLPNPKAHREIGELAITSPVTEEINPSGSPRVRFMEGTRLFEKEALVTIVNLY